MRIGILKTGTPPRDLDAVVPTYPAMIRAALGMDYSYREFDVEGGEIPIETSLVDAYIITGSSSGVHDPEPWIGDLQNWLKSLEVTIPLIGICFGHQIMAQAYGGVVRESSAGWASGLQRYAVRFRENWMDEVNELLLPAANHDQVLRAPPDSRVLATSESSPYAALSYCTRRALSFQGHPEFEVDYTMALISQYERVGRIGVVQANRARASLAQPDDRTRVIGWIRRFLAEAAFWKK
jgi:GMP synthase-like glutamine amidotransferase